MWLLFANIIAIKMLAPLLKTLISAYGNLALIFSSTIMRIFIYLLFTLVSVSAQAETIKPFTSDGCSMFPDGTFEQKKLWLSCCTAHDYSYWQGGSYEERLFADEQLQLCVANVGQPQIANLMLAGVRVGGSPYLPTSFRWGYGWSYPRFYKALTAEEKRQIPKLEANLVETNH